jgi:threonine dehydratase
MAEHRLSLEQIARAARSIDPVFLHTPQFVCEPLSQALGIPLLVKVETLNPIRSFKGRGADFFLQRVLEEFPQRDFPALFCASAGNFGQAMAYVCRKHGFPLTIYASIHANPLKVERMKALGAQVVLQGDDFDAAKMAARKQAQAVGGWMVEDGFEVAISEGAGSIGVELLQYPQPLAAVVVPLGNGALLGGVGRWIRTHSPQTQIIGVQAAGAPAMERSWRSKTLIELPQMSTIADGIGVRLPIPEALQDIEGLVDEVWLVSEEAILEAMRLVQQHLGLLLEPSGAAGLAALLEHRPARDGLVGTLLCGGNLTEEQRQTWL